MSITDMQHMFALSLAKLEASRKGFTILEPRGYVEYDFAVELPDGRLSRIKVLQAPLINDKYLGVDYTSPNGPICNLIDWLVLCDVENQKLYYMHTSEFSDKFTDLDMVIQASTHEEWDLSVR